MEFLAWLVVGVALGAASAWLVLRAQRGRAESDQVADLERARADAAEARSGAAGAAADLSRAEAVSAAAEARRDAAEARMRDLVADREQLVNQFKALSAESVEKQGRQLDASADIRQQATEQLLAPVKESLELFNRRITEVEKQRVEMSTELRSQVSEVRLTGETLRRETAALVTALRKPQVRGSWGELQLKRVVELAGMVEHCDFETQLTTRTTAGDTIRPDLKVMLSEDRYLWVDSKVPLSAFLEAYETDDPQVRAARLAQFARNVKTHVDQLGGKDYYKATGGTTPEFVVMFLGSEALAAEAFQQLPDLHEYAADRRVVLATPSSLIALLKATSFAWRQAGLAESAREVFDLGRELYDRLGTLGSNFDRVGRSLTGAVNAYNSAVGSIEGRVFPTARKLRELQVTEAELVAVNPVEVSVRPLTATELVEDAAGVPPMIGRARTADDLLVRAQPELDDLLINDAVPPAGDAQTA